MTRSGTIQLGTTKLKSADEVERLLGRDLKDSRRATRPATRWFVDEALKDLAPHASSRTPWQLKLSGQPVLQDGKREAIFLADDSEPVVVDKQLWADFMGRHALADIKELCAGDLVWLQHKDKEATAIRDASDIESLQWARWGRAGEKLLDVIGKHHGGVMPDSFRTDGMVDEVTDLFGQVPFVDGAAGPFAGRLRPENLVFAGVRPERAVALAPLAPPHPGCAAFYRDCDDVDRVSNTGLPLRGYKVYRTTAERGADAPWLFSTQGVYDNSGAAKTPTQKVNKSAELVPEGAEGTLRIAFYALSPRELALVLLACSVDWRLGGGKSLGLGHCRTHAVQVYDELGVPQERVTPDGRGIDDLPADLRKHVQDLKARTSLWQASQRPVPRMRYPRAVSDNNKGKARGGHAWFQRHATPKKSGRDDRPKGLEVQRVTGPLQERAGGKTRIRAQALPKFDPARPEGDVLYGYDLINLRDAAIRTGDRKTVEADLQPFAPKRHVRGDEQSGGKQSPNADDRKRNREARDEPPRQP
jgi:hypothetical protein